MDYRSQTNQHKIYFEKSFKSILELKMELRIHSMPNGQLRISSKIWMHGLQKLLLQSKGALSIWFLLSLLIMSTHARRFFLAYLRNHFYRCCIAQEEEETVLFVLRICLAIRWRYDIWGHTASDKLAGDSSRLVDLVIRCKHE